MDIVERLREFEATDCCSQRKEAANEIERLQKDLNTARDAHDRRLQKIERLLEELQYAHNNLEGLVRDAYAAYASIQAALKEKE